MRFSNFALLDLPNIQSPQIDAVNSIDFKRIESFFIDGGSVASPALAADSFDFAESLQNYALNLETLLLQQTTYDSDELDTVAEKVFFKWLKTIGALRFVDSAEATDRYEENEALTGYNKVVQYVGGIDIDGSSRNNSNAYKEIYMLVPTQHGSTPKVVFKSTVDRNYPSGIIQGPTEFIVGRDATDSPTNAGLLVKAQYDVDLMVDSLVYTVDAVAVHPFATYLGSADTDCYVIRTANDPSDVTVNRDNGAGTVLEFEESLLEGIGISFDKVDYEYFRTNPDKTFAHYNTEGNGIDFNFNAIAIYYDVWDNENPTEISTNLYGILFLDDLEEVGTSGSKISVFSKQKPNDALAKQGNSFGLRLNMKFDVLAENVESVVEVAVNDYNTFSMILFADAMERMRTFVLNVENEIQSRASFLARFEAIEGMVMNNQIRDEIYERFDDMAARMTGFIPNQELIDMLVATNTRLDDIVAGNGTIPITYRFNIVPGGGINVERIDNNIHISGSTSNYASVRDAGLSFDAIQSSNIINVLPVPSDGTVFLQKALDPGNVISVATPLKIYMNDTEVAWKDGLTVYVKLDQFFDFQGGIEIYTDALNRTDAGGVYGVLVGAILPVELDSNKRQMIEIHCISASDFTFFINL
jgi:hypothetical protein